MITFRGGRLPNNPEKPRLRLAPLLTKAPIDFPENKDWLSRITHWPMYLNDRIGDCTFATIGHKIQIFTTYGQGHTVTISDNDVLTGYEAVAGYDPRTGANDNGAVIQDVLNYWRKTGVGGHKILAFAEVNVNDTDEVRAALASFGTVYLGINFPNTAMDQFNAGQPWDVVPGATIEGGHAINAGYYDVSDAMWKIVTWGEVHEMTQAFWDKYVEEAWVVISEEWLDANNHNPDGVDISVLGEQFTEITGEASPFPAPVPQPVPTPVPQPENVADEALARFLNNWLSKNRHFYKDLQKELRKWLDSAK